jgi:hypothetical protein
MLQVYELVSSEKARTLRKFVHENLISKPEDTTPEERQIIEEVSVVFDRVGALVSAGLVPQELLFQSHARMISRIWSRLEPYIIHYRQVHPGHVGYFESLAKGAAVSHQPLTSLATGLETAAGSSSWHHRARRSTQYIATGSPGRGDQGANLAVSRSSASAE